VGHVFEIPETLRNAECHFYSATDSSVINVTPQVKTNHLPNKVHSKYCF